MNLLYYNYYNYEYLKNYTPVYINIQYYSNKI